MSAKFCYFICVTNKSIKLSITWHLKNRWFYRSIVTCKDFLRIPVAEVFS